MSGGSDPAILTALFEAARKAQAQAYAPYSRFPVGAALCSDTGAIYAGCNVENAAYPAGVCAETSAISAMVAAGDRRITDVLVIGDGSSPVMPCGACRQRLFEFGSPETRIHMATASGPHGTTTLGELLPHAFGPHSLAEERASKVAP